MDKDKIVIARWIVESNDELAEIEHLLDKAYPDGAEDSFYRDWENVFSHLTEIEIKRLKQIEFEEN